MNREGALPHEVKSTLRQKKLAKLLTENYGTTKKELFLRAGYSLETAAQPEKIINTVGFKAELAKLGLTEEFIVSALVEDIRAKPQHRAFELSTAGKWLGLEQRNTPDTQSVAISNSIIVIQSPDKSVAQSTLSDPLTPPPSTV